MATMTADTATEVRSLLMQAMALLDQSLTPTTDSPLTPQEVARIEKLGPVAHLHLAHIEEHGSMTRADSLAIRRRLYGDNVQATANLFGTEGSGALFYRVLPYGTPVKNTDPVDLTAEGRRVATLYRTLHNL